MTTTTTTIGTGQIVYTQETSYAPTGMDCLPSASNSQSSVPETVTSASSGTQPTTQCLVDACPIDTITQGSLPSPSTLPNSGTTGMGLSMSSTDDSTWEEPSGTVTTHPSLDTSVPANSATTSSMLAATETGSKPSTTTTTGLTGSSTASSASAHHSTTTSTTPFTGSSGAEKPLVALAAMGVVLSSMLIQVLLL